MTDQLIKALAYDDQIRIYVIDATQTVAEAQKRHESWHTATAVLGRTLVATLLLAGNLKGNDRLSVQIKGTGPAGLIASDGDTRGNVRGYVSNPKVALPLNENGKLDVAAAVGLPGSLYVRKYIADGEPFTGQVELVSGELGDDFTYYMAVSEQTPSAIGLSVLVNPDETVTSAGGFMIQVLPGASEETISELEKKIESLGRISNIIDQSESIQLLLDTLVGEDNYRVLEEKEVRFNCPCSKEGFAHSMGAIGQEEIQAMIDEDHGAEVVCHYCNEKYNYTETELKEIIEEMQK